MTQPGPIRPCKGCTVEDDHPRHGIGVMAGADPAIKPEIWHLDCHAAAGCVAGTMPDGELSCAERLAQAGNLHGAELAEHFASLRGHTSG